MAYRGLEGSRSNVPPVHVHLLHPDLAQAVERLPPGHIIHCAGNICTTLCLQNNRGKCARELLHTAASTQIRYCLTEYDGVCSPAAQ